MAVGACWKAARTGDCQCSEGLAPLPAWHTDGHLRGEDFHFIACPGPDSPPHSVRPTFCVTAGAGLSRVDLSSSTHFLPISRKVFPLFPRELIPGGRWIPKHPSSQTRWMKWHVTQAHPPHVNPSPGYSQHPTQQKG